MGAVEREGRNGRRWAAVLAAGVMVVALTSCVAAVARSAGPHPPARFRTGAYILTSTSLYPIDTSTDALGTPITLGSDLGTLAVTPDGKTAFVAAGDGDVFPVDVATGRVGKAIRVGCNPAVVAMSPHGVVAFVLSDEPGPPELPDPCSADPGYGAEPGEITEIVVATRRPRPPVVLPSTPFSIAFGPDGGTAYVECRDGSIVPVDVASDLAGPPIEHEPAPSSDGAESLAVTPDGKTLYVLGAHDTVTPIDLSTRRAGQPIPVGGEPQAIAISPGTGTALVVDDASDRVTPIEIATNRPGAGIRTGVAPGDVALSPDGDTAYVGGGLQVPLQNPGMFVAPPGTGTVVAGGQAAVERARSQNDLAVIDVVTRRRVGSIMVGGGYDPVVEVVVAPSGRYAYALTVRGVFALNLLRRTSGPAFATGEGQVTAVVIVP